MQHTRPCYIVGQVTPTQYKQKSKQHHLEELGNYHKFIMLLQRFVKKMDKHYFDTA